MDRLQQARGAARISTRLHQPRSRGSQPRGTTPGRGAGWLQSGGAGSPRSCRTPCSQNIRSDPSQHHCRGASPLRSRSSPCQSSRNNCAHQRGDGRGGVRALRRRSAREQRAAQRRNSGTKMVHKLGQTLAAIERARPCVAARRRARTRWRRWRRCHGDLSSAACRCARCRSSSSRARSHCGATPMPRNPTSRSAAATTSRAPRRSG